MFSLYFLGNYGQRLQKIIQVMFFTIIIIIILNFFLEEMLFCDFSIL